MYSSNINRSSAHTARDIRPAPVPTKPLSPYRGGDSFNDGPTSPGSLQRSLSIPGQETETEALGNVLNAACQTELLSDGRISPTSYAARSQASPCPKRQQELLAEMYDNIRGTTNLHHVEFLPDEDALAELGMKTSQSYKSGNLMLNGLQEISAMERFAMHIATEYAEQNPSLAEDEKQEAIDISKTLMNIHCNHYENETYPFSGAIAHTFEISNQLDTEQAALIGGIGYDAYKKALEQVRSFMR